MPRATRAISGGIATPVIGEMMLPRSRRRRSISLPTAPATARSTGTATVPGVKRVTTTKGIVVLLFACAAAGDDRAAPKVAAVSPRSISFFIRLPLRRQEDIADLSKLETKGNAEDECRMVVVAMQHVGIGRRDHEWHPAQRQHRDPEREVLPAPVSDERHLLVHAEAGASKDADAAALGRAREAVEVGAEAAVTDAKIRGEAAERIAFALPQAPDLGRDAVVRLRRVERPPTGEILPADGERKVTRQHSVQLDA